MSFILPFLVLFVASLEDFVVGEQFKIKSSVRILKTCDFFTVQATDSSRKA